MKKNVKDRFMEKVNLPEDSNKCWEWTAYIYPNGYGMFCLNSKNTTAHRASYILFRGNFDPMLQVCHTCDNRKCVNPNHLFIGTTQMNTCDRHRKGRSAAGETSGKNILMEADVREIKASFETQLSLSKRFGVSRSAIALIKCGINWKCVQ